MDYYADAGAELIGLGGMVGTPIKKQMRWAIACMKHAAKKYPGIQFHGWGVAANTHFRLPWYSVDSSGWMSGMIFGRAEIFNPLTKKQITWTLNNRELFANHEALTTLRNYYRINPKTVAYSNAGNRATHILMAAISSAYRQDYFNSLHKPLTHKPREVNQAAPRSLHLVCDKNELETLSHPRAFHLASTDMNAFKDLSKWKNNATNAD